MHAWCRAVEAFRRPITDVLTVTPRGTVAADAGDMSMRSFLTGSLPLVVVFCSLSASAQERIGAVTTPGSAVSVFGNQGQIAISSEAGAAKPPP